MRLLCIFILLLVGCSKNTPDTSNSNESTSLSFSIDGMHCQACVDAITASVLQVEGVTQCTVSLEEKNAVILVNDPTMKTSILDAIRSLNFTVEPIDE